MVEFSLSCLFSGVYSKMTIRLYCLICPIIGNLMTLFLGDCTGRCETATGVVCYPTVVKL